mmetsp:Transcript_32538/g.58900  ORF Transcript_32538/g.58900 Transcript_32538/m.58900 type:complete len:106 (+) Transcript_32538:1811-2128(+)
MHSFIQSLKWSRTTLTASATEQKSPSSSFACVQSCWREFRYSNIPFYRKFYISKMCTRTVECKPSEETGTFYGTCSQVASSKQPAAHMENARCTKARNQNKESGP